MNFYKILSLVLKMGPRMKLTALWLRHITGGRYLGMYIDPVLGCNYRCKMCYLADPEVRKMRHGKMSQADLERVSSVLMNKALKVQIGCATEPSLAIPETIYLIRQAKAHGVKLTSLTTNGALLNRQHLQEMCQAGLDELIISCHGIHRETYEYFMGGNYDVFLQLLDNIRMVRQENPSLKLRINYTMNAENTAELKDFWQLFGAVNPDVLQLRAVQDIGSKEYDNYNLEQVASMMDNVIAPLRAECQQRGMLFLAPEGDDLKQLDNQKEDRNQLDERFQYFTHCYVCPDSCFNQDFYLETDTYRTYARRNHLSWRMFKSIFMRNKSQKEDLSVSTKPMTYKMS